MSKLITDWKHWLGWTISALLITTAIIIVMHFFGKHCVHTPIWVIGIIFVVVFIVEVIVDIVKHLTHLQ